MTSPFQARAATAPRAKPTAPVPVPRPFALPHRNLLSEARRALAFGGIPPRDRQTPEDSARVAAFHVLQDLLRFLDVYRRRIEAGGKWRVVKRDHEREPDRLVIEFVIEVGP